MRPRPDWRVAVPLILLAGVAAAPAATAGTPSGGIQLRVVDGDGAALTGMCVTVYNPPDAQGGPPSNQYGQVRTGQDGVADFTVPSGSYSLGVSGCSGDTVRASVYYGSDDRFSGAKTVTVGDGDAQDLNDVVDPLAATISGTVRDSSGSAYAGACVESVDNLSRSSATGYSAIVNPTARAAGDGSYTLTGLYPRPRIIGFRDCDASSPATFFDHVTSATQATPVQTAAGQDTPGVDGVVPLGGTVEGTLSDDHGKAVTSDKVCVQLGDYTTGKSTEISVGNDGTFRFTHLPIDAFSLFANLCYARSAGNPDLLGVDVQHLGVSEGGVTHEDLVMDTGGQITWVVRDANGQPLAGMCVHDQGNEATTSADDGSYTLAPFRTGPRKVAVTDCGQKPALATAWYPRGDWPSQGSPVQVTQGSETTGIDLALDQPAATLSGRVTDDLGNPVSGACVTVYGPAAGDGLGCFEASGDSTTADDGGFAYRGLPAGPISVKAAPLDTAHLESTTSSLTLEAGGTTQHDLVMPRAGSMSGRVVDQRGLPILGVRAQPICDGASPSAGWGLTDSDGAYHVSGLSAGNCTLRFTDDDGQLPFDAYAGYPGPAAEIKIAGGSDTQVPLQFVPTVTVPDIPTGVQAVAGEGSAVIGWSPPASDGYAPITAYTVTDATGRTLGVTDGSARGMTITGLAVGRAYVIGVDATNRKGAGATARVTVVPTAHATAPPAGGRPSPGAQAGSQPSAGTGPPTAGSKTAPSAHGPARISLVVKHRGRVATLLAGDAAAARGRIVVVQYLRGRTWVTVRRLTESREGRWSTIVSVALPPGVRLVRLAVLIGRRTPAFTGGLRAV